MTSRDRAGARQWALLGLAIVGVLGALALVAQFVAARIVDAEFIRERIASATREVDLEMRIGDADFDLLRRQIDLTDVEIEGPGGARLTATRLRVRGVPLGGVPDEDPVELGSLRLESPVLHLPSPASPDSSTSADSSPADPSRRVRIGSLQVRGGTLVGAITGDEDPDGKGFPRFRLQGVELDARDVVIGRGGLVERPSATMVRAGPFERLRSDSLMRLSFETMTYDSGERLMVIDSPAYAPTVEDDAFFSAIDAREDRVRASASRLEARGYDLFARLNGDFLARAFEIDSLEIDVFSNKRIPSSGGDPWLPHELAADFDGRLGVDSLVASGRIVYAELPPQSVRAPGRIAFDSLRVRATDISNDPDASPMVVEADFRLWEAEATTRLEIPLTTPEFRMQFTGRLGPLNLTRLSSVTVPLQGIEIQEGRMEGMRFDIEVEGPNAGGTVWLVYDDLDIQLVDRESGEGGLFADIKSFVANTFVLDDDNVAEDGEAPDPGRVAVYLPGVPFFSRLWVPVREGMMAIAKD